MPRPVWKGQVSFGLVSIPVVLYTAERSRELSFNLIDRRNRARVRYERVNEATGKAVPYSDIVKGYEYEDGQYVLLGDEDFRRAAVDASKTVEIQEFIGRNEIDPRYYERPYYLVPEKRGARVYVLLRDTLARSERVGIAKVVIHTRQYMGAVYPYEDALVLVLLRFPNELHALSEFDFPHGTGRE